MVGQNPRVCALVRLTSLLRAQRYPTSLNPSMLSAAPLDGQRVADLVSKSHIYEGQRKDHIIPCSDEATPDSNELGCRLQAIHGVWGFHTRVFFVSKI